ncbi:MAG: dipeptidase [Deltaproteobacteria bacterium]|nr:dipeptidase [Deltaproteobacteria bacterium]
MPNAARAQLLETRPRRYAAARFQRGGTTVKEVLHFLDQERSRHLDELCTFLSIPSVSTRSEHKGDVRRAAQWVADQLGAAGLGEVTINDTPGHPVVTARSPEKKGAPTVLVYGHYDVQPAEPLELWQSPPFTPEVRGGKLFARGAADDKGQVFIHLKVLEAFRRTVGELPVNVKVLIEGEEEIGSPNLVPFVKKQAKALACDVIVVSDTHMVDIRVPSITTGLRGLASLEVTVQGAKGDLHSGSYGGSVANPIQVLAEILSACKHPKTGKVLIPGFYDQVRSLTKAERASLAKVPHSDDKHAKSVGAPAVFGEKAYTTLERIGARPTFEVNGIWGGYTGEGVKTVLPSQAHAKISMRLVADQDPEAIVALAEAHLKSLAPPHATVTVKRHKNLGWPVRVSTDFPAMRVAADAVKTVFGKEPAFTLEGGSIPVVADFKQVLGRETILLGFGLPDDNLHAPNEKFDLRMLDKGMKTVTHFLAGLGRSA